MSVNAYLVKEINITTCREDIIIEKILEKSPSFCLNNNEWLLNILQENHCSNINCDLTGEIIIDKYIWKKIIKNLLIEKLPSNELNIINKITNDLKNKEIIQYECY